MPILEGIQKLLQISILILALAIIIPLLFWPDAFGSRASLIFESLRYHGIELEVGTKGVNVAYTRPEAERALETQSQIDALSQSKNCLSSGNCTKDEQTQIAEALNVSETETNTQGSARFFDFWIVIIGADKTIAAAGDELRKIEQLGYQPELIFVDNWYRSVAKFNDKQSAETALSEIQRKLGRPDAYLRFLPRWCSDHERVDGPTEYVICNVTW